MQPRRAPIPGLDALRGIAAAAIVLLHVWLYSGARGDAPSPFLDTTLHEFRVGVTLFFVLSAYLLARPWLSGAKRPSTLRFFVHRAARILPAFWLAVLLAFWVVQGTRTDPGGGALPSFFMFTYDQVPGLVPMNPPLWSLAIEVSFYAVLPLLGLLLLRGRALAVVSLMVAGSLVWCESLVLLGGDDRHLRSLPTFLGTFGCGIAAAAITQTRTPDLRQSRLLLAGGAALVLLNGVWHGTGAVHGVSVIVRDLPAAVGFAMIVVAVAHRPAGLLDIWPLRRLGDLSYGLYLYHWPVIIWMVHEDHLPEHTLPAVALVFGVSLLIAQLSHTLVERPVVKLARKLTYRPAVVPRADSSDSIALSGNSSSWPQPMQIASYNLQTRPQDGH